MTEQTQNADQDVMQGGERVPCGDQAGHQSRSDKATWGIRARRGWRGTPHTQSGRCDPTAVSLHITSRWVCAGEGSRAVHGSRAASCPVELDVRLPIWRRID